MSLAARRNPGGVVAYSPYISVMSRRSARALIDAAPFWRSRGRLASLANNGNERVRRAFDRSAGPTGRVGGIHDLIMDRRIRIRALLLPEIRIV